MRCAGLIFVTWAYFAVLVYGVQSIGNSPRQAKPRASGLNQPNGITVALLALMRINRHTFRVTFFHFEAIELQSVL